MRVIFILLFSSLSNFSFGQTLNFSPLYHMEQIDCPDKMFCERRMHNKQLFFLQVFTRDGQLHSEYLRSSDTTFEFTSFHLMDHFKLISKPSYYGQKTSGTLVISDQNIGPIKEGFYADNYESYNYHDTLLIPVGKWTTREYGGKIQEVLTYNDQGQKDGFWESSNQFGKTIKRTYQADSLINTVFTDEISKPINERNPHQKLQGTWNVTSNWDNQYMTEKALGKKENKACYQCSRYTFLGDELTIRTYEKGKPKNRPEKFHWSFENELLILKRKDKISQLKLLYLSTDRIYFISTD